MSHLSLQHFDKQGRFIYRVIRNSQEAICLKWDKIIGDIYNATTDKVISAQDLFKSYFTYKTNKDISILIISQYENSTQVPLAYFVLHHKNLYTDLPFEFLRKDYKHCGTYTKRFNVETYGWSTLINYLDYELSNTNDAKPQCNLLTTNFPSKLEIILHNCLDTFKSESNHRFTFYTRIGHIPTYSQGNGIARYKLVPHYLTEDSVPWGVITVNDLKHFFSVIDKQPLISLVESEEEVCFKSRGYGPSRNDYIETKISYTWDFS